MQDDEAEPKMGARMTGKLEHDQRYYQNTDASSISQFRRERMRTRQVYDDDDDEDEEDVEDEEEEEDEDDEDDDDEA